MFGKNVEKRKEADDHTLRREAGDLATVTHSGPGVHGFSAIPYEEIIRETPVAEPTVFRQEDVGLIPGGNGKGESQGAPEVARQDSERDLSPVYGDAADALAPVLETGSEVFMIIHRSLDGVPNVSQFDRETEAQEFVEDLLGQGVQQRAIETYRALKQELVVSFRPVVNFRNS